MGGNHQHRRRSVNLDGWTLQDEDGHTYTFDHYRLEGRTAVGIHTGHGATPTATSTRTAAPTSGTTAPTPPPLRNDHGRFIDDEPWGHHRHSGPHHH
ncbi:hypothetical protein GCM10010103_79060 [Streptomyces paradoxus]|uniref:LTD domain-containing protein n=1 Tax=Streptomyces paradoxus TaxID=66375 RepID=A0A7W9TIB8_9ACTN|nr:hypothetical protein [Streptomyces paradoxus]